MSRRMSSFLLVYAVYFDDSVDIVVYVCVLFVLSIMLMLFLLLDLLCACVPLTPRADNIALIICAFLQQACSVEPDQLYCRLFDIYRCC